MKNLLLPSHQILTGLYPTNLPCRGTCNGTAIIEGFASDTGLGGVNYVEDNKCPVGHTRNGEKCQQVCTHCTYEDEKGYFGDKIPSSDICGVTGVFDGIDYNGFVKCKINPYLQKISTSYSIETINKFPSLTIIDVLKSKAL